MSDKYERVGISTDADMVIRAQDVGDEAARTVKCKHLEGDSLKQQEKEAYGEPAAYDALIANYDMDAILGKNLKVSETGVDRVVVTLGNTSIQVFVTYGDGKYKIHKVKEL